MPSFFNVVDALQLNTGKVSQNWVLAVLPAVEHSGLTQKLDEPVSIITVTGCLGVPRKANELAQLVRSRKIEIHTINKIGCSMCMVCQADRVLSL